MINPNELKRKLDEAMKLLRSSSGQLSNIKPGNLESLIQALATNEDNEVVDTLSSLHDVLDTIKEQAMEIMSDESYKVVENQYADKPKKVQ